MLWLACRSILFLFFLLDAASSEIYTLSLHDALPICSRLWLVATASESRCLDRQGFPPARPRARPTAGPTGNRSEEHTSELQSPYDLVCRLLLEKKKKKTNTLYLANTNQHNKHTHPIT